MTLYKIASIVVLLVLSKAALAVEVQQGVVYGGGTHIESSQVGVSFTIPQGWQGAWPNGSQFFILESSTLKANLFLMFDQVSKQKLQQIMSQTIPLDSGISLQPLAKPVPFGDRIEARYSVMGSPQAMDAFVSGRELRPGFSVAVIALSQGNGKAVEQMASKIISAMETKAIASPQQAKTSGGGQSWQDYMKGRYIARYYSGSQYSEKEQLWLCSNGVFYSSFNAGGYSMNGASGASANSGQGRWRAEGNVTGTGTLILQFGAGKVVEGHAPGFDWTESSAGGEQWTYQLDLKDKLYLNNTQWLRGNNDYCN